MIRLSVDARALVDETHLAERARISKELDKVTSTVTQVYMRAFIEHVPSRRLENDARLAFKERANAALENTIIGEYSVKSCSSAHAV